MAGKKSKTSKKGSLSTRQKVGIGVGLTATALAAVGGYFFYGSKNAAQNRKKARSWMLRAKAEVLEELEKAKHITREEYEELVMRVVEGYRGVEGASTRELAEFASEMHDQWRDIEKAAAQRAKQADKKTASKKTTKKTTKKSK